MCIWASRLIISAFGRAKWEEERQPSSHFEASLGYLGSDMSVRLGYSISNFPFQIKYIKTGILQNLMYGIRVLP